MTASSAAARRLWQLVEPIHAVVYFSPEPAEALGEAGYRGYWMGYFAARAAPLGEPGTEIVRALFYNFSAERVARAVPAAWDFAPPAQALAARLSGSTTALRRILGPATDGADVAAAAELAARIATVAPVEGRALFAANQALTWPDEPLARLWHAATLLREHRGDGHVAALLAAGIDGRESHVFHALATGTPREIYTASRDFTDEEWTLRLESLRAKRLVDGNALSRGGISVKAEIEARTDAAASSVLAPLTQGERDMLMDLLSPIARAVVASGEIPTPSPIGLDLRTVG